MAYKIIPITNSIVSCYLVKTNDGFFMVDTGVPFFRGTLKRALKDAGCKKGNLKLVVITHGDFDHTGNARYLQKKYGAIVIAHKNEARAVEKGDMTSNRKIKLGKVFRVFLSMFKLMMFSGVKPDIYIEGDCELTEYGIDAKIVYVPGHSTGSVGAITKDGDFFCGDLFNNTGIKPVKNALMDDEAEMDSSIAKLKELNISKVYPGHGKAFTLDEFFINNP